MSSLVSEYDGTIDSKGRLVIPSPVRPVLGSTVMILLGLDPCLCIYSMEQWRNVEARIAQIAQFGERGRQIRRTLGPLAEERAVDDQGRVLVSENLRKAAGLTREIKIVGVVDKLEVWDPEAWARERAERMDPEWRRLIMDELGL